MIDGLINYIGLVNSYIDYLYMMILFIGFNHCYERYIKP